jgi:type II secretory pathway pseudopilin PulG/cytoskeletal protein CcmA (bactofilin family)
MRDENTLRQHAGFSLLELGLTLGLVSLALVATVQYASDSARQVQDAAAADRMTEVSQAALQYLQAQGSALTVSVPVGSAQAVLVGRASTSAPVPAGSLQALGYLPATYVDTNSYNQGSLVVIRQTTAGNLDLMVETTGGRPVPDADLGRISAKVGAAGGMVQASPPPGVAPGTIQGTGGGYSETAASWSAGGVTPSVGHTMAITYANQTTVLADYLYRNNIGVHAANTMNTDIDMSHHGIDAVATLNNTDTTTGTNAPITVSSTLQGAAGGQLEVQNGLQACAAGSAAGCNLAVSPNGAFYDENDGWIRYRGPAAGAGLALDGPAGTANNLYVAGTTTSMGQIDGYGGVALKGSTYISWPDITGAYLGADGSNGFLHVFGGGLAVDGNIDSNGSVNAAGDMSAGGNLNVGGSAYASGAIGSGTSVSAADAMYAPVYYDSNNASYYVQPSGTSMLNSVVANNLTVNGGATVGGVLNANGGANVSGDLNVSNAIFAGQVQASNGVEAAQGFDGGPASFYALPANPAFPALSVFGNGGVSGNLAVNGTLCTPRGCY